MAGDDLIFSGNFTQQEALSEAAITAAVAVMRSGRIHRYNVAPGEESETVALEQEYAAWQGARYCLAVASGGQAMQIALRAAGVQVGQPVLTNAFTLAPVPGAIAAVGASPVLVEITEDLTIDFDDLAKRAKSSGAKVLLLSNMRGHLCDMERLCELVDELGLILIEDCAHTMGAEWRGRKSGNFGLAGCFSTQTYKHINSGEGGILTSDDAEFIARATILSGSYMNYIAHGAGPAPRVFDDIRYVTPNMSARMDNLRAAILRPQLTGLRENITRWRERYDKVATRLGQAQNIRLTHRPDEELFVGSSIQFFVPDITARQSQEIVDAAALKGVELKWFGAAEPRGFTSAHQSWRYMAPQDLPNTDQILSCLFDIRLPLTFNLDDCSIIAEIATRVVDSVLETS